MLCGVGTCPAVSVACTKSIFASPTKVVEADADPLFRCVDSLRVAVPCLSAALQPVAKSDSWTPFELCVVDCSTIVGLSFRSAVFVLL